MPISNNSSARAGVMPKPAAEFSPLAMIRSARWSATRRGSFSLTIVRPGLPKISPIKRMRMTRFSSYHAPFAVLCVRSPLIRAVYVCGFSLRALRILRVLCGNSLYHPHLGGLQEIVISGRVQTNVSHPLRAHQHIIEVPQVDRANLLGKDSLQPPVDLCAFLLIEFAPPFLDQLIHLRIAVKPAVGSTGRETRAIKYIENIWVFISADPAQRVHLKQPARDVRKKGRKLEAPDLERDLHLPQLLLQHRRQQARALVSRGFHHQMKAHAASRRVAGFV